MHECAADAAAGVRANFYADPHLGKGMHTADGRICIVDLTGS